MNHEIAMLQSLSVCNKYLKKLNKRCMNAALNSFSAEGYPNGTLGQISALAKLTAERDAFLSVMHTVCNALNGMPKGYRALLVAIYVKKVPRQVVADKYGVSLSTVYRKLTRARKYFRIEMEKAGFDAAWFVQNFKNYECALNMFRQQSHELNFVSSDGYCSMRLCA